MNYREAFETPAGVIRNRTIGRQLVDFSGLRWGSITPTDIDVSVHRVRCSVDISGRIFAWVEYKYGTVEPSFGQLKHLGYLISNSRAPAIAVIARHQAPPGEDIDGAGAEVSTYMTTTARVWCQASKGLTVFDCLDKFFREHIEVGSPRSTERTS